MSAATPLLPARNRNQVLAPTLGLYLDRPAFQIPDRALQSCRNVRIRNGQLRNENMGWEPFPVGADPINLDGEDVLLIEQHVQRSGAQTLVFGNRYDLFRYDASAKDLKYITPTYSTGQVTAAVYAAGPDETTLTGSGTSWATDPGDRNGLDNVEVGDRFRGWASGIRTQGTWFTVTAVNSDTEIVVSGDATAGFSNPSDYTIRQVFQGDLFDLWQAEMFPGFDTGSGFEDRLYLTNGLENLLRWRGPTLDNEVTRLDLGFTCRTLLYHKNLMLYGDLVVAGEAKPRSIKNSDVGQPEVVDGTGLSSEFIVVGGVNEILSLKELQDLVVSYNNGSIDILQFVGLPFIFVARTAVPDVGPIAAGAVVDQGDFHEFLGHDEGYRFNGVAIEPFGRQVFREVLRTLAPGRISKLLTHVDEEHGEVQWIVPLTTDGTGSDGAPQMAYTEHYLEDVGRAPVPFTFRDLPATATGYFERAEDLTWQDVLTEWRNTNFRWNDRFFEAAFPFNLFGTDAGFVFILGSTDTQHDGTNTVALVSRARGPRRALIHDRRRGFLSRLEPYAEQRVGAAYPLRVGIYTSDRPQGPAVLAETLSYDLTQSGERFLAARSPGRYFELEYFTLGQFLGIGVRPEPWELAGWLWEARALGERGA